MSENNGSYKAGWREDVAALAPSPAGHVAIGGRDFPIYSFLDLPAGDAIHVAALGDEIMASESMAGRIELTIEQLVLLSGRAPGFEGALRTLTPRQLVAVAARSSGVEVPREAGASGSADSSPASAGSTAGGPASS
mgnify:CR=1 FL=1